MVCKLDLKRSSCQVDEGCIVYCKSHANVLLDTSDAKLFRIITAADKVHYVWRDSPDDYEYEFPGVCRAFTEDGDLLDDDIFNIKVRQRIIPDNDIFCFGGYVYFLHRKPNGNLIIRRICAYSSQKIVEQIISEDFHDIVAESVYLVNFYIIEGRGRHYVMTCWGVVYQGGFLYIPIFDEDRHFIYERPVQSYIKEEIPSGTVFKANGIYYQTATDEEGKLYLNYSRNPFLFNQRVNHLITNENRTARIIQANFKKESNGT
ncbi:MAG: hypothetical protein IJ532_03530 [Alphaproteobacteria bacterium]|nr:hypothetical protein [Alphaproteobacteria bacterium]